MFYILFFEIIFNYEQSLHLANNRNLEFIVIHLISYASCILIKQIGSAFYFL